ncbi:stage III sporulation protein AE [Bacillus marinisedimentorum]|uniref:stage III sporulation protein AE n=1 Tax=Bacillus marinisedimentorum TaxID=1821260 RepID=UPI000872D4E0|nr:stage III sporulation protein AE [Bacillus marinisedimentorum]
MGKTNRITAEMFGLIVALFLVIQPITAAHAQQPGGTSAKNVMEQQADTIGVEDISVFWDRLIDEYGGFLPESQKGSLLDFIKGEKKFSLSAWFTGILKFLFYELTANGKLLGTLIMLTVFSVLLQSMQNAFEKFSISKVAYAIVYMVLIVLALNSFHVAATYAEEAINTMIHFILGLLPLLLALMAASGGFVSASFFHPIIIFIVNTSGLVVQYFVLPLLFLSALLSIVSTLTENYKVTQLADLLKKVSVGSLGVLLTIFLGVISVQGASTAITDGITVRTARFVTGNFVPIIGRLFTEATDTVLSASVLLKNTVGIAGAAVLLGIALFPAIKVLSLALIYKLAAAMLQPLGGGPVIDCLDVISKSVIYVFAALLMVSFMFFLAITIVIAASNIMFMFR